MWGCTQTKEQPKHDLLAAKLAAYGMCPDAVRLLINYLKGRKQKVKYSKNTGEWMKKRILGPSFFNLFLKDLIFALLEVCLLSKKNNKRV